MADTKYLTVPHLNRIELARFFAKVEVDPQTNCWNWTGTPPAGYGLFSYKGIMQRPHRLMYAWVYGPIPTGPRTAHLPEIDHYACDNVRCCNPAHLRLVTCRENILRGSSPTAHQARKTHCSKGHPLPNQPNEINNNGQPVRRCKECRKTPRGERGRLWRERMKQH